MATRFARFSLFFKRWLHDADRKAYSASTPVAAAFFPFWFFVTSKPQRGPRRRSKIRSRAFIDSRSGHAEPLRNPFTQSGAEVAALQDASAFLMSTTATTTSSRAVQRQMDLRDPRYRPMANVNTAMRDLDLSAEDVGALVESGDLMAFNIALNPQGRKELRILTASIAHYLQTLGSRPFPHTLHSQLSTILPHDKPMLSGVEVQRALNCDSGTVINLVEARALKLVPRTDYGAGRGCTPSITRESFIAFLKARLQ
jgi:hypothetical protein